MEPVGKNLAQTEWALPTLNHHLELVLQTPSYSPKICTNGKGFQLCLWAAGHQFLGVRNAKLARYEFGEKRVAKFGEVLRSY